MRAIELVDRFVPQGANGRDAPVPAVRVGAGARWLEAYQAVTTQAGRYVQGGGCTTVGVAGLVLGGGFGNFSKGFGTGAANLLEADVVTADGVVRVAVGGALPCQREDPALWFSSLPGGLNLAKAYCRGCRNRHPCLEGALDRAEPAGAWGGEIFEQGRIIENKRARGRPPRRSHMESDSREVRRDVDSTVWQRLDHGPRCNEVDGRTLSIGPEWPSETGRGDSRAALAAREQNTSSGR
jgi:hypothetical protein